MATRKQRSKWAAGEGDTLIPEESSGRHPQPCSPPSSTLSCGRLSGSVCFCIQQPMIQSPSKCPASEHFGVLGDTVDLMHSSCFTGKALLLTVVLSMCTGLVQPSGSTLATFCSPHCALSWQPFLHSSVAWLLPALAWLYSQHLSQD